MHLKCGGVGVLVLLIKLLTEQRTVSHWKAMTLCLWIWLTQVEFAAAKSLFHSGNCDMLVCFFFPVRIVCSDKNSAEQTLPLVTGNAVWDGHWNTVNSSVEDVGARINSRLPPPVSGLALQVS